jgi:hypothetical protein
VPLYAVLAAITPRLHMRDAGNYNRHPGSVLVLTGISVALLARR